MRYLLHTTTLTLACLWPAASIHAQGKDTLTMEPTKPTVGNFPPLPRAIDYQLLGFSQAGKPLQFPGLSGGLLIDPNVFLVVPGQSGYGSELVSYLQVLGATPLYSQRLYEESPKDVAFSELLRTGGKGLSKQIDDLPTCEARAYAHLKGAVRDGLAEGWARAGGLLPPTPMYRPDVLGVAYYEFPVDVGGFIVVSTGEHDLPIAHFNDQGPTLATALQKQAGGRVNRIFKLDSLSYVGEDEGGRQVAQLGNLPAQLLPDPKTPGGYVQKEWPSWPELKGGYVQAYRPMMENLRLLGADQWHVERNPADSGAWGPWSYSWAGSHSDQRLYNQFTHGSCYVGCGPVAWMMLFGWADYRAGLGDPRWAHRWGLYRENGGRGNNAIAPTFNDAGIDNAIREINGHVATFCIFSSGATFPWDMHQADRYLSGRTGATLTTHYNSFGIHEDRLRNLARDSIQAGTPAIIGTGWLSHYPLAYGYAVRSKTESFLFWERTVYSRWFYVNNGWGGSSNGWVEASTWFCGRLFAN
jgi:hypothetical protein